MKPQASAWLVPYLNVRDPNKSLAFYAVVFGFEKAVVTEEGGKIVHAEMTYQGQTTLMFKPEGLHNPDAKSPATSNMSSPLDLMIYAADVDAVHSRALAHGGKSLFAPEDVPWGERHALIHDLDGYPWLIASLIEKKS